MSIFVFKLPHIYDYLLLKSVLYFKYLQKSASVSKFNYRKFLKKIS